MTRRHAILIASSDFLPDSGIETLRYPVNDVNEMETVLSADDFHFDVIKIINQSSSDVQTKLETWLQDVPYEDLVLIYYSGHGKLNRARELYLSCANTRDTILNSTAVPYKWLMDVLLREHSLQQLAVILDCCYAGRAIAGSRGASRGAVEEQVRAAVTESWEKWRGHFFLGASGANQTAEEREQDGHGRFTKHIIHGLRSGDADMDGDGYISAKDLASYVKRQLRSQNASQEPIEGGEYQGELILGGNRRRQLKNDISKIQVSLESNKNKHFTRETFRKIEDYLETINDSFDIVTVLDDPRLLVLKKFASNDATVEQVAKAFWRIESDLSPATTTQAQASTQLTAAEQTSEGDLQTQAKAKENYLERKAGEEPQDVPPTEAKTSQSIWKRNKEINKQHRMILQRQKAERKAQQAKWTDEDRLIKEQHRAELAPLKADSNALLREIWNIAWVRAVAIVGIGFFVSLVSNWNGWPLALAVGAFLIDYGIRYAKRRQQQSG
jgi:hypothetical protein